MHDKNVLHTVSGRLKIVMVYDTPNSEKNKGTMEKVLEVLKKNLFNVTKMKILEEDGTGIIFIVDLSTMFYDDESTVETLRFCVEQDLEDAELNAIFEVNVWDEKKELYLKVVTCGGQDKHDIMAEVEQVSYNNKFAIESMPDVSYAIADDLVRQYPYISGLKERVLKAIEQKDSFRFKISDGADSVSSSKYEIVSTDAPAYKNEAVFSAEGKNATLKVSYSFGTLIYNSTYISYEISNEDAVYVVTENFMCPNEVEQRLYHEPFRRYANADRYMDILKGVNNNFRYIPFNRTVCLDIRDMEEMKNDEWYKLQKQAMELMREKGVSQYDASFRVKTKDHIEELQKL